MNLDISYSSNDEVSVLRWSETEYGGSYIDRKVDRVELSDGNYLGKDDIDQIIQDINAYASNNGIDINSNEDIKQNQQLMNIITSAWHS